MAASANAAASVTVGTPAAASSPAAQPPAATAAPVSVSSKRTAVAAGHPDWNALHTPLQVHVLSYLPVLELLLTARRISLTWKRAVPITTATAVTRFNFGQFWASLGVVKEFAPLWTRLVRGLGFYRVRQLSFAFCDHMDDDLFIPLCRTLAAATAARPKADNAHAALTAISAASVAARHDHDAAAAAAAAGAPPPPPPFSTNPNAPAVTTTVPGALNNTVPSFGLAEMEVHHRHELYAATAQQLTRDAAKAAAFLARLTDRSRGVASAASAAAAATTTTTTTTSSGSAGAEALRTGLVTSLDLFYCCKLTDAAVAEAVRCFPNLETLNLGRCFGLTERAVAECAKLKHLKRLSLASITGQPPDAPAAPAGVPSAEELKYRRRWDDALQQLEAFPALTSLDLTYCSQFDAKSVDEMRRAASGRALPLHIVGPDPPLVVAVAPPSTSSETSVQSGGGDGGDGGDSSDASMPSAT